jgi:hypothetical protein
MLKKLTTMKNNAIAITGSELEKMIGAGKTATPTDI